MNVAGRPDERSASVTSALITDYGWNVQIDDENEKEGENIHLCRPHSTANATLTADAESRTCNEWISAVSWDTIEYRTV